MKSIKLYTKTLFLLTFSLILSSCEDFLDRENPSYSPEGFYRSEIAIEDGVAGIYNGFNIGIAYNVPFNVVLDNWTPIGLERAENMTLGAGGAIAPDNTVIRDWWTGLYRTVTRSNLVISGAEPYLEALKTDGGGKAMQYLAEARVLRAFAYYYLISTYGAVPFFTKQAEPKSPGVYNSQRTDPGTILDFIIEDINNAAEDLPWIANERGRVDRAVAYGIVARAALHGGSLNYNGKGASYLKASAEAAKKVIGQRSLAANFDDLFNKTGQAKADVRNESLFEIIYSDQGVKKTHMIGFGQVSRNYGQTGRHPSQMLIDTYECIDGKRIDESPLYDPKKPGKNRDPRFNYTFWIHGDTVEANRNGAESGKYKFVLDLFNYKTDFYDFAKGTWNKANNADLNSAAAWTSFAVAGVGYIWRKYAYEKVENISAQTCNVAIMRYPEILLTYAEAKIELKELDNTVYDAINQVRNRVGMPSVSEDRKGNQDKMRQLVRRERKVEFANEGLHFADMRRWKTGALENESPSYGYTLAKRDATGNVIRDAEGYAVEEGYDIVTPDMIPNFKKSALHDLNDIPNYDAYKDKIHVRDRNRFWDDRFYLFPIPQTERDRDTSLEQNPGY